MRKIFLCFVLIEAIPCVLLSNAVPCDDDDFFCLHTYKCIDSSYVCDGDNDCGDLYDERDCDSDFNFGSFFPATVQPRVECDPSLHFKCPTNNQCINKSWVCDGDTDCPDGHDEENCATEATVTIPYTQVDHWVHECMYSQYECNNGEKCVNGSHLCDGVHDCMDGSDERLENCLGVRDHRSSSTTQRTTPVPLLTIRLTTPVPVSTTRLTTQVPVIHTSQSHEGSTSITNHAPTKEVATEYHLHHQGNSELTLWLTIAVVILGVVGSFAIMVTVFCKKRKNRTTVLNTRTVESQQQSVIFLNSNTTPEHHQLIVVSTPVQLATTSGPSALSNDQPPPYDSPTVPLKTSKEIP